MWRCSALIALSSRQGLIKSRGLRGRRKRALARRQDNSRWGIPSTRQTPPAPVSGTTQLRCRLMPRQWRDAGANTNRVGPPSRGCDSRCGDGELAPHCMAPPRRPFTLSAPARATVLGARAPSGGWLCRPEPCVLQQMGARSFASSARGTSVATARFKQTLPGAGCSARRYQSVGRAAKR
jgi:hypothetical protein